jgi:tRNA-dihydrouridine synthase
VAAAKEHLDKSLIWKGEKLGVLEMRRHYTNYFRGLRNIKNYRKQLVTLDNPQDIYAILDEIEHVYNGVAFISS